LRDGTRRRDARLGEPHPGQDAARNINGRRGNRAETLTGALCDGALTLGSFARHRARKTIRKAECHGVRADAHRVICATTKAAQLLANTRALRRGYSALRVNG